MTHHTKITNGAVLAAMMVVAIHTGGLLNTISHKSALWWFEAFGQWGIFAIAVPFFFVCSGYFLAKHFGENFWWQRECKKRVHSLLVPYIVWSLLFALLPCATSFTANLMHGRIASIEPNFNRHFWIQLFGLSPFCYPGFVPLWYIRTLLVFVIASPVLWFCIKTLGKRFLIIIYIVAIGIGIGKWLHGGRIVDFFYYFFKIEALVYFCIGCFFQIHETKANITYAHHTNCFSIFILGIGLLLVLVSVLIIRVTGQEFANLSRVLYVPPLLFAFWQFIPEHPLPKWLTGNTFAIYLVHDMVLGLTCIHSRPVVTIPQWIAKWAIAFSSSILVAMLLRRFTPSIARILFGGR